MEYWHSNRGLLLPGRTPVRRGICSMFMATHLIGFAAGQSGGTTWVTTFTAGSLAAQGSRANYGIVNRYSAAELSQSATAGKVRITFTNSSGGGAHTIDSCYIGHQAGAGDAYDFDGGQVQVTIGASGSFSINTTDTLSDEINFSLDEAKTVLIALKINTGSSSNGSYESGTSASNYEKSGATDTATTDKSGYSGGANGRLYVKKIEVWQ